MVTVALIAALNISTLCIGVTASFLVTLIHIWQNDNILNLVVMICAVITMIQGVAHLTKFLEKHLWGQQVMLTSTKGSISFIPWLTKTQEPSHTVNTVRCSVAVMDSPQTLINIWNRMHIYNQWLITVYPTMHLALVSGYPHGIQIVLYGETVMEPCLPSNSA